MSSGIVKTVQGTFHQGHPRFGNTAGIQFSCNTLVAVFYSKCRNIAIWKPHDLDYILTEGDLNFKQLGFTEYPYVDQFAKAIYIEDQKCAVDYSEIIEGEFVNGEVAINFVNNDTTFNYSAALIIIKGYTIAVMFGNDFYVFDSHSRDAFGKISQNGHSIVMQFRTMKQVKKYVFETYASGTTCLFQIVYIY